MKRIAIILGALMALLLVGAVAAATFLIDPNHFRPMLEPELTQALGREVKLGDLKLSILSGSVTANDLSIADDPAYSRKPFVQAKSLAHRRGIVAAAYLAATARHRPDHRPARRSR